MLERLLLAALLVLAGFAVGRWMPRPAASPPAIPVGEPTEPIPGAKPIADVTVDRALRNDLASTRAQLAICLAFRAPPEPDAPAPPPGPAVEMDEETARLVRTHTTNADVVLVQGELGSMRAFPPGAWPPPGGPPLGSRIIARKVDGGMERYVNGGTELIPTPDRPMFCPCPRDAPAP